MPKQFLEASAWPLCLAANTLPVVAAARYAPQWVPQAAAAATLLVALVLLGVERACPYRADWSVRGDGEVWRDLGHSFVYVATVNGMRLLLLGLLATVLSSLGLVDILGLWPGASPLWLQILLVIVLGDALEYFYHRASHAFPALWRMHAIHHTPVRLHALKGARHHFLYAIGRGAAVWLPLLLLGAPASLVYWQFIAETVLGLVGHANVRFRIPAFAHRLLVTPEYHRLHHSADAKLGNSNFGVVFPMWDRLFGTHADPLEAGAGTAGVPDDPVPRRFLAELKWPFG